MHALFKQVMIYPPEEPQELPAAGSPSWEEVSRKRYVHSSSGSPTKR